MSTYPMIDFNLIINVTEDDINEGRPGDPNNCPVAIATNRALKERGFIVDDVEATNIIIVATLEHKVYKCWTPDNLHDWINDYDQDEMLVNPTSTLLSFELEGIE